MPYLVPLGLLYDTLAEAALLLERVPAGLLRVVRLGQVLTVGTRTRNIVSAAAQLGHQELVTVQVGMTAQYGHLTAHSI